MDSPYSKSDPLVLLLNELDILSAQTRLLELHLNRAARASRDQLAGLQEQHHGELKVLRSALAAGEERLQFLESRSNEERRIIERNAAEILQAKSDNADLKNRIRELESSQVQAQAALDEGARARHRLEAELVAVHAQLKEEQQRLRETQSLSAQEREQANARFSAEVTALRSTLATRDHDLGEHQSVALEIERRLKDEALTVKEELERQRMLVAAREEELHDAHARVTALEQRSRYFEAANQEMADNVEQLEGLRRAQEAEIATLRHQVTTQERALTERQEAVTAVELALHGRIQAINQDLARARREIEEQRAWSDAARRELEEGSQRAQNLSIELESRLGAKDEELGALRAELEAQRSTSERRHTESEQLRSELDRARRESATKIQEMHARLAAGEDDLIAAQARDKETADRLQAEIDELRLQVAEKHLLAESHAVAIESLKTAESRSSGLLAQQQSIESETKAKFLDELETIRAAHQTAVGSLQEERRVEREALENELAQARGNLAEFHRQILELKDQQRQAEAVRKSAEDAAAEDAASRLREPVESGSDPERTQNGVKTELAGLREEVQAKAWSLARQQAAFENLALAHKTQLQKLEIKIDEQERAISERDSELETARAQTQSLERRIESLQQELKKTERTALDPSQKSNEEKEMSGEDRNQQDEQSETEIQRRASESESEPSLRDEIGQLRREAQERNQILQDRNDELVRVKTQLDGLHERLNQLESSTSDSASSYQGEAERMRTDFQAQLALLQAELSQKEWALEERQAMARGIEQDLRQEIESLRRQLAESQNLESQSGHAFVFDEPASHLAQDPQFLAAGNGATAESATIPLAGHRRWNTGFGWKRRWRS